MSTDSLPNPKPLSALVVTEGEKTEIEFFEQFGKRMGLNLELHAVKCNVYTLFKWMTEDCADADLSRDDLVLDVPKLIAQHEKDQETHILLQRHYDALYLVYDCDLQDSRVADKDNPHPIEKRARANFDELEKMIQLLNDEYSVTVGKLYLNYPMFEACWDADSFSDPAYQSRMVSLNELPDDGYKHRVKGRLLHHAWRFRNYWKREDFYGLIRMNVCKAVHLLEDKDAGEHFSETERFLSQKVILEWQKKSVAKAGQLAVLNTSVFLPIEQFGAKVYTQIMKYQDSPTVCFAEGESEIHSHCDFMVFMRCVHPNADLLLNQLKGLIRVFFDVDVIVFPDHFCHGIPDYHNAPQSCNMSNDKAKNAVLLRLQRKPNVNWCCRTTILNGETPTILEVVGRVKRNVIFVH